MVKYADIAIRVPANELQIVVQRALNMAGFNVTMVSASAGRVEKGSSSANVMLGALATHHVIDFEIFPAAEGGILRLVKTGSGASGGLLGMRKANKEFEKLTEVIVTGSSRTTPLLGVKKA